MATPINEIRSKTNRVKQHILNRFLVLAEKVDKEEVLDATETLRYNSLMEIFAKSVVPRTQEITGEDGEAINVNLVKYADNTITIPVSSTGLPNPLT